MQEPRGENKTKYKQEYDNDRNEIAKIKIKLKSEYRSKKWKNFKPIFLCSHLA